MYSPVDSLKSWWHEDLVNNSQVHGWVLNLYRAGEKYPQLVEDYFPWKHAPWKKLRLRMQQHEKEESRHERIFARVIEKMGEPLVEFRDENIFNDVVRKYTKVSFRILSRDSKQVRQLKLAHFLAHAHCLEKRVLRSLEYHLEACERAGNKDVAKAIRPILHDEGEHVVYTREAVSEILSTRRVKSVMKLHSEAEARANLKFSQLQVKKFLRQYAKGVSLPRRSLYRFCSWMMEMAVRHG